MSDDREQVARVLEEADRPADASREEPLAPDLHADRTRQFSHTSFSRMRRTWTGGNALMLAQVKASAEDILRDKFRTAYAVMDEIYKHVRKPLGDPVTGEIRLYPDGSPMWEEDGRGIPVEDWSLLDDTTRSDMLHMIYVHEFEWAAEAANIWAEAMYAKVEWEVTFASAFSNVPSSQVSGRPTIDDKTQHGHRYSAQERYFAVYCSHLSRRADALVKSMTGIRWLLEKTTIS